MVIYWIMTIAGALFIAFGAALYFFTDSESMIAVIVIGGALFIAATIIFSPCEACGYYTYSSFCERCGNEIDPKITCECGRKYSSDSHPAYCPDCGFELESVGD